MIFDRLAPYYDQFIDPDLNNQYLEFMAKLMPEGTVIDLGCGTGPLAVELAKAGYFVTATDISTNMLERANHNAVLADVTIHFFVHNILEPLNQPYDAILMSSDVINYLDNEGDVLTAFQHVSDAMNKESIFIFDFIHIQYIERIHNYKQDILLEDDVLTWSVRKTNVPHQIEHELSFGRNTEQHIQTTFPLKTYKRLLQEAGLTILKKKRTDERVIVVAKRK
jgi:2-polyprenyl-3-methyl-5-hydroxy-6-metoxy-1,4-benzoquinol methylase